MDEAQELIKRVENLEKEKDREKAMQMMLNSNVVGEDTWTDFFTPFPFLPSVSLKLWLALNWILGISMRKMRSVMCVAVF